MIINKGAYLTLHVTVGGRRTIVIGIPSHLLYGEYPPRTYPPKFRRLTGEHPEGV